MFREDPPLPFPVYKMNSIRLGLEHGNRSKFIDTNEGAVTSGQVGMEWG